MSFKPQGNGDDLPTPEDLAAIKQADVVISKSKKLNPRPRAGRKTHKERERESKIITRFMTEFLDTFVVIGYNTSGEECVIMKYSNPLEERALTNLMDEFFTHHFESLTENRLKQDDDYEEEF